MDSTQAQVTSVQVPESKQDVPESKQEVPESKQEVTESKRVVPESKQDVPESKQEVPESKQVPQPVPEVTVNLQIPSAKEFKETCLATLKRLKEEETTRKAMQEAQLVAEYTRLVEEAFKLRLPESQEVMVLIEGEKVLFPVAVEKALLAQGYNVEYNLSKKAPGKTLAYIYPAVNPYEVLNSLMKIGGLDQMLDLLLGPADPATTSAQPVDPSV